MFFFLDILFLCLDFFIFSSLLLICVLDIRDNILLRTSHHSNCADKIFSIGDFYTPSLYTEITPPLLSVLFTYKYKIFILFQVVTLCCGLLLLDPPPNTPNVILQKLLAVNWVSIPSGYRDIIGKIPYVIFIGSFGVILMYKDGFVIFNTFVSVFQVHPHF